MEAALTRSPMLAAAMKRVADPNYKIIRTGYQCSICCDDGYIVEVDGKQIPYRDAPSGGRVQPCTCQIKKEMEISMSNSGIDINKYKQKSFETFIRDTEEARKMYDLANRFLDDNEVQGVGYFGQSGAGKTHICIAICNELAKKGIRHRYLNYREDLPRLKALMSDPYAKEEFAKEMNKFKQTKVLYIDDLFKLAKNSKGDIDTRDLQIVFDIINYRYINGMRIIISSEYTVAEIKEFDEATAGRIFEMMKDTGLKITGNNRRFKK